MELMIFGWAEYAWFKTFFKLKTSNVTPTSPICWWRRYIIYVVEKYLISSRVFLKWEVFKVHWRLSWALWKSEGSLWEAVNPVCFMQVTWCPSFAVVGVVCLQVLSLLHLSMFIFKHIHVTQGKCDHSPFNHQTSCNEHSKQKQKKYQIIDIDLLIQIQDWGGGTWLTSITSIACVFFGL